MGPASPALCTAYAGTTRRLSAHPARIPTNREVRRTPASLLGPLQPPPRQHLGTPGPVLSRIARGVPRDPVCFRLGLRRSFEIHNGEVQALKSCVASQSSVSCFFSKPIRSTLFCQKTEETNHISFFDLYSTAQIEQLLSFEYPF